MSGLAEFGFEYVDRRDVEPLFLHLVKPSGLTPSQLKQLRDFLAGTAGDTVAIWPIVLALGGHQLQTASLHAWPVRGRYWVELLWDMCEVGNEELGPVIKAFHQKAIDAATRFGIAEYYGGLEPAHRDEDTRFFTRDKEGPLRLGRSNP